MFRTHTAKIFLAVLFLTLMVWLTGKKTVDGQGRVTPVLGISTAKLQQRQLVLDRQEARRNEILDRLEFLPRFPVPKFPFPFPELCLPPATLTPASAIDPHRSLFVHDQGTLTGKDFSLKRTLGQIAAQVVATVPGTTAGSIFRQFWDTQNNPPGVLPAGPHCTGTVNGFPINCPRNEGSEAVGTNADIDTRMGTYKPIALVNRIDLAPQGWRNCGEFRIVYGKSGGGFAKNFIIFEAVLPNPKPGCREGCLPVAEFWKDLSAVDDANERAKRLEEFYYAGLPGFRPVVHVDHYNASGVTSGYGSSGSGQIRTNQFLQTGGFQPWLLKEFKTVIDCGGSPCNFAIIPTMVRVNPHGPLWNADNADPRAVDFQADTLLQMAALGSGNLAGISYNVDLANDAGQSMSLAGGGFVDNYRDQMNAATSASFRTGLPFGSLTADQMANRALTQSCAGCHQPSTFGLNLPNSIGTVLTPVGSVTPTIDRWPAAVTAGFVHVDIPTGIQAELAANSAAFGTGQGQEISRALLDFFLPDRKNFLLGQLNAQRCECKRRFTFIPDAVLRRKALELDTRVRVQFEPRITELDRRLLELQGASDRGQRFTGLGRERAALVAERDKTLVTELERGGIKLLDDELLQLKPQVLKLKAANQARGSREREAALRIAEVNQLLKQEPQPRRVTGSFRTH